ncbi:prolyl oligopeptidase family serine peptidase [bacterium]|nr:prolyl oligopeptidase family serine peptidase [bacterium]
MTRTPTRLARPVVVAAAALLVAPPAGAADPPLPKQTHTFKTVGGVKVQADVYRADDAAVRPVVVWIHGGALVTGNRKSVPSNLLELCRAEGYALVSIDYRLAPEVKLPEVVADVADALRWVRGAGAKECRLDADRVVVTGGSAGGYLTLMAGAAVRPRPTALIAYWGYGDVDGDWYTTPSEFYRRTIPLIAREEAYKGVGGTPITGSEDGVDFKARGRFYHYLRQNGQWTKEVTGFNPATDRTKLDPYCPVRNVTAEYPPTLLVHGTEDTDVPYQLSADMARELARHKVPHELVTVAGAGHGLSGGNKKLTADAHARALAFIRTHLAARPKTAATPQQGRAAVEKGLDFLLADAAKWRKERECSTCHHGTMTVWALTEAKLRGYGVTADAAADALKWTKDRLLERIDLPRDTRPGWSMVNTPALYLSVMAAAAPKQDAVTAEELRRIAAHLLRHQEADGSWAWSSAPAKNRPPPVFESDEVATLLGYAALGPRAPADPGEKSDVRDARARAAAWLAKTDPSDTTQAAALRLLVRVLAKEPSKALQPGIDAVLGRQNGDGGWGQLPGAPSDAYATGQVLYVLSLAGVRPDRAEVRRAVSFLVTTQKEDGSWPMTPRSHPGVTPAGNLVPITYFGSAWATIGLVRAVPR